jgi:hypothetical protein
MLHAFVFSRCAVLVRHWFEIGLIGAEMEHGVRLELRLLADHPRRGTESAAQRFDIDRPVWRADLFDRLDQPVGSFSAAHFHPYFDGDEPSERVFRPELTSRPFEWAQEQLADIAQVCRAGGVPEGVVSGDVAAVRAQSGSIVAAARSLAASECHSVENCHAWTADVAPTVRLMVSYLRDPSLLDRDHVAPWLEQAQ